MLVETRMGIVRRRPAVSGTLDVDQEASLSRCHGKPQATRKKGHFVDNSSVAYKDPLTIDAIIPSFIAPSTDGMRKSRDILRRREYPQNYALSSMRYFMLSNDYDEAPWHASGAVRPRLVPVTVVSTRLYHSHMASWTHDANSS